MCTWDGSMKVVVNFETENINNMFTSSYIELLLPNLKLNCLDMNKKCVSNTDTLIREGFE